MPLFPLKTMCPYSEQVHDIEHYSASIGDDIDAKINYIKHIKCFFMNSWNIEKHGASIGGDLK